jgi:hypothetical protein
VGEKCETNAVMMDSIPHVKAHISLYALAVLGRREVHKAEVEYEKVPNDTQCQISLANINMPTYIICMISHVRGEIISINVRFRSPHAHKDLKIAKNFFLDSFCYGVGYSGPKLFRGEVQVPPLRRSSPVADASLLSATVSPSGSMGGF